MQLDYRTLNEPVTDAQIRQYAAKDMAWINRRTVAVAGVLVWAVLTGPLVAGTIASGQGITAELIAGFIILSGISWGVVWAVALGTKMQAQRTVRLKRFAEHNGAVFVQNIKDPGYAGMIFDAGHTRKLEESLAFDSGVELGNYSYVTGSGKNRSVQRYNFARISLSRNLPHLVLDAKSNNFFVSNLPSQFNASQRMSLEGDFDKYFSVYAPKGYERDALYVFTPDVMQVLVDQGKDFDMEIVGSELFVFRVGRLNLAAKGELEKMLMVINAISAELRDQTRRYQDERAVALQPGVVAEQGRRLKKGMNWVVVGAVATIIAWHMLITLAPPEVSIPTVVIGGILFWGVIGAAIIRSVRSRR